MIFSLSSPLTTGYSLRHLRTRKTQSLLTILGVALVVFVFAATLMLAQGLRQTLSTTGSPNNAIVLRTGAQNEIQSGINREHAAIILSQPEVQHAPDSSPKATTDMLVLVSLRKRSDGQTSNVNIRGVSKDAPDVRAGIRIVAGRAAQPGTREVIIGKAIHDKFLGTDIGQSLRLVGSDWKISGIFDAGNSAFSSEIWGDVEVMMPTFRRDRFSSVTFPLRPGTDFQAMKQRLENDRRLSVTVERESEFYASQSRSLALFIQILGGFISIIFSLGAIIGAMITMYSSVANRTREIGVLRALGFSRAAIFRAFAKECVLMGLLGGILGIFAASILQWFTITTTNFATFSEVAFGFRLTPAIAAICLLFAAIMGFIGGTLPALRAARLEIVEALRAR
jgi:ABC-type antimicrobial peptide transport system permease subunit